MLLSLFIVSKMDRYFDFEKWIYVIDPALFPK